MLKKWLIPLFVLLFVLLFLPQIASTPLGKPLFERAMERKTGSKVKIGSLHLSWLGPQIFRDIEGSREGAGGIVEELQIEAPFWSFSGPFRLKNGSVAYQGGRIEQIEGEIRGEQLQLTGVPAHGKIAVRGTVRSPTDFHLYIDLENFPMVVLDPRLPPFFGPLFNVKGFVELKEGEGPVQLDVTGPALNAQIRGTLASHIFSLRDPAVLKFIPELPDIAFRQPVVLHIEPTDFFLPFPFSLDKCTAHGSIDLGQFVCRNSGNLDVLIQFLKATHFSNTKEMNIWLTPCSFSLQRSHLEVGRVDALLANAIHLCGWGTVDLARDQLAMVLGLPADTLQKSFGIRNLSSNYVMKVEVRGSIQNPELVTKPAVVKIAALIAAGQLPKKGALGGIAKLFSHPKKEKDVPPPQRPFPWER